MDLFQGGNPLGFRTSRYTVESVSTRQHAEADGRAISCAIAVRTPKP